MVLHPLTHLEYNQVFSIKSQVLVHQVSQLSEDDNRADDHDDRERELNHDEDFPHGTSDAGPTQSSEDVAWLKGR